MLLRRRVYHHVLLVVLMLMHGVDVFDRADHELGRAGPMVLLLVATVSDGVSGGASCVVKKLLGVVIVVIAIAEAEGATAAVVADRVTAGGAYVPGCDHVVVLSLESLLGVPHALAVLLHIA